MTIITLDRMSAPVGKLASDDPQGAHHDEPVGETIAMSDDVECGVDGS